MKAVKLWNLSGQAEWPEYLNLFLILISFTQFLMFCFDISWLALTSKETSRPTHSI